MKRQPLFFLPALVAAALYLGCAYSPGPDLTPGKTVPPKAGSYFVFKSTQTDTLGIPIDSTTYYYKDSVAETGMQYQGKTNVTHFVTVDTATGLAYGDTYINYETNGDISIYTGSTGGLGGITLPPWRTYPVQSHTTAGYKIADSTLTLPGIPLPIHVIAFDTLSFVGDGTYPVSGKVIPVFNSKDVISYTASAILININTSTTSHIEFAPSLGYIISEITDPTKIPAFIPSQGGQQNVLVSFVLK